MSKARERLRLQQEQYRDSISTLEQRIDLGLSGYELFGIHRTMPADTKGIVVRGLMLKATTDQISILTEAEVSVLTTIAMKDRDTYELNRYKHK